MHRINKFVGSQLLIIQSCLAILFLSGKGGIFIHLICEAYINTSFLSFLVLSLIAYSFYHVSDLIFQHEKLVRQSKTVKNSKK